MANRNQTGPDRSTSTSPNPSGQRPRGPEHFASEDAAAAFAGLAESDSHKEIGRLLNKVGSEFGWQPKLIQHFQRLLEWTRPQDWLPGAHPIVWLSVRETAIELGISKSQVRRNEKKLHELGAISWKDSANHRRFGRRDNAGNIENAYGIDLSPSAALLPLLRDALAAAGTHSERKTARTDIKALKRSILAAVRTALEAGRLDKAAAEAWRRLVLEASDDHDHDHLPTLTEQLSALQAIEATLRKDLATDPDDESPDSGSPDDTDGPVDNSVPEPNLDAIDREIDSPRFPPRKPPYDYPTREPLCANITVAQRARRKGKAGSETRPDAPAYHYTGDDTVAGVPVPAFLAIMPEEMRSRVPARGDIWPAIVDAAADIAASIGVSQHAWGDACLDLGRERAAVALTVVAVKHERGIVYSPGGYFRQMTRRHASGKLHLRPSVFGLLPEGWRDRLGARDGRERLQ